MYVQCEKYKTYFDQTRFKEETGLEVPENILKKLKQTLQKVVIMNPKILITFFLGLLIVVVLFHIAVIAKIIPYDIAWGGRIQNDEEMYVFETLSILINLFLGLVLLMKGNFIKFQFIKKTIDIISILS